jgi:anti-anti-sigma factor
VIRPEKFEITETQADSATTVAVTGELDMLTTELLRARLSESLRAGVADLTLDLRALAFMDSTGLRLLIELNQRAQREGWRLRLLAPTDDAAALVLRVTAVDAALPFESPGP